MRALLNLVIQRIGESMNVKEAGYAYVGDGAGYAYVGDGAGYATSTNTEGTGAGYATSVKYNIGYSNNSGQDDGKMEHIRPSAKPPPHKCVLPTYTNKDVHSSNLHKKVSFSNTVQVQKYKVFDWHEYKPCKRKAERSEMIYIYIYIEEEEEEKTTKKEEPKKNIE